MEAILFGLATNVLTRIAGKLGLSKTYAAMILCLIGWIIYYTMITYFEATWEEIVIFITGSYATSQAIYNLLKKRGILEKIGITL